ncbi:MAG: hypothetical protein HRU69_05275 [Flammeovirgaceae bacterium]|nr:MAG: hypothetical protein HRU69_05275 [Flammeovirgaceae bacterium]
MRIVTNQLCKNRVINVSKLLKKFRGVLINFGFYYLNPQAYEKFITFHYVSLLLASVFYFSKSPLVFSQNLNWVKRIAGQTGMHHLKGMTSDGSGNIFMVGHFEGTIDLDPGPGT